MGLACSDIVSALEKLAPPELAEPWDRVGLQMGSLDQQVNTILVCLDVTPEAVDFACRKGAQLLVSHHPLIWQPLHSLRRDHPDQALLLEVARHDIGVYVMHTNWDKAPAGVNACLARMLGLEQVSVLQEAEGDWSLKLVTFVPAGYDDQVREAMADAGAGVIGAYSHCSFQLAGTGTFKPQEGASPFLGTCGRLEKAEEFRLEMIVPTKVLGAVLTALHQSHPYEEIAYDLYPLANRIPGAGLGRVGNLRKPQQLEQFAKQVKQVLKAPQVRMVGHPQSRVERVAVCGGSGSDLIAKAAASGADVLVTGDLKYHQAKEAQMFRMAVLDAGHWGTESVSLPFLAGMLSEALTGVKTEIYSGEGEPWSLI